jgi:hypothetical protein
MREMHAQKSTFWRRCSQRKREAGTAIEPVWTRQDCGSSAVKKLYDSDHSRAWRCSHTAFRDTTRPDAQPRRSMEFPAMAYFSNR